MTNSRRPAGSAYSVRLYNELFDSLAYLRGTDGQLPDGILTKPTGSGATVLLKDLRAKNRGIAFEPIGTRNLSQAGHFHPDEIAEMGQKVSANGATVEADTFVARAADGSEFLIDLKAVGGNWSVDEVSKMKTLLLADEIDRAAFGVHSDEIVPTTVTNAIQAANVDLVAAGKRPIEVLDAGTP